jgi:sugar lactone lactonase YvrE
MIGLLSGMMMSAALISTAGAGGIKVINDDAYFPEGPLWHDGKLFYVEYGRQTVMTWDGKQNQVFWKQDGCGPSAVASNGAGDFFVTCYDSGSIAKISPDVQTVANYTKDKDGHTFVGPNDFAADKDGGIYFTASGPWESAPIVGDIFYIAKDGTIALVADDIHAANGLALTLDGKTLYCAETEASRLIQFTVQSDASLTDRRMFVELGELMPSHTRMYPDGIKIDSKGNIYIGADTRDEKSPAPILVTDSKGKFLRAIDTPSLEVPNLAFGPGDKMIYAMALDELNDAPWHGQVYEIPNE